MSQQVDTTVRTEAVLPSRPAGLASAVLLGALWLGGAAIIAVLVVQRYRGALGATPLEHGNNVDFASFFRAARDVADGRSPYDGNALYTYFAPLALILSLAAHADPVTVLTCWTMLGLCALVAAAGLVVWALRDRLDAAWQVPVLFTVCAGVGLHVWPTVYEFFLGNDDIIVLLLVVVAAIAWSSARPVWFGSVVGVMCLIKIWPALLLAAVMQSGVTVRRRVLAAAAFGGMVVLGFVSNLIPAGFHEFTGFVGAIHRAESLRLVSNSVTGIPEVLFSSTGLAKPVVASVALRYLLTAVLIVWVVGLLVVSLGNQREQLLCVFNIGLFTVLVIPVSHMCYTILALPVVWFWLANFRVLLDPSHRHRWRLLVQAAVALSLVLWVLLQSKAWPGDGYPASTSSVRFTVVFAANLALYSASVLGGRLLLGGDRSGGSVSREVPDDQPTMPARTGTAG